MATFSGTFDAPGETSSELLVKPGESVTYSFTTAALTGSVVIERALDGGWQTIASYTDTQAATTYTNESKLSERIRLRCEELEVDPGAEEVDYTLATVSGDVLETLLKDKAGNVIASLDDQGSVKFAVATKNTASVGTPGTGVTAVEYGDGRNHQTVLTVSSVLPAIAGGAELGVGKLLYTLPAGAQLIDSAYMSIAITQTEDNITADTPEVGVGTVIASGAVAVLSGTATFEDIITGQVAADCDGTATVKGVAPTAGVPLEMAAGAAKTIHLNVADDWAADGDAAALLTGTVVLNWRTMA